MDESADINEIRKVYEKRHFEYEHFLDGVESFFKKHPRLNRRPLPLVHSVKSRVKDIDHFVEKVKRKIIEGNSINVQNVFQKITDLAGVRVLHLHQDQFPGIHEAIIEKVNNRDWHFVEDPVAYSWDPESKEFYDGLGITAKIKPSFYTSIHYVVKPNPSSPICCEIQVRTLFEEIWGEIDHTINYPIQTESIACKEQLRVLSKLVSTGTRLADSIFRSYYDHNQKL